MEQRSFALGILLQDSLADWLKMVVSSATVFSTSWSLSSNACGAVTDMVSTCSPDVSLARKWVTFSSVRRSSSSDDCSRSSSSDDRCGSSSSDDRSRPRPRLALSEELSSQRSAVLALVNGGYGHSYYHSSSFLMAFPIVYISYMISILIQVVIITQ